MRQLRLAIRLIARQRGFTLVATLILGLCLGANVAILSAVNALLLQPLPYPGHDRLAALVRVEAGAGDGLFGESRPRTPRSTRSAATSRARRASRPAGRPAFR